MEKKESQHHYSELSTAARWFKQFQEGRKLTEDVVHTGRPSITIDHTSIAIVSTLLDKDRQMMVGEMEVASDVPKRTIHHILNAYLIIGMGKIDNFPYR